MRGYTGRDREGNPTQVSRTVYGTNRDAQRVAAELTVKPARNAGGRKVAQLLDEWLEIGESLPTFVQAVAADSGLTINRDEFGDDHRVVEGTTAAETTIVYVAAFDDGWNFYVECGLSLGVRGDDRLIDEIVEVCRATVPVGE